LRQTAANPKSQRVRQIIESFRNNPAIFKLGLIAIVEGKEVSALFTGIMMKSGSGELRNKLEKAFHYQTPADQAKKMLLDAEADFEAERMLTVFKRLRNNKPALIIAEANQAIELGRLFRAKVLKATAHSPRTKLIVRRVVRALGRVARKRFR